MNLVLYFVVLWYKIMLDYDKFEYSNFLRRRNRLWNKKSYVIIDETGIHARPVTIKQFKTASKFDSDIQLE